MNPGPFRIPAECYGYGLSSESGNRQLEFERFVTAAHLAIDRAAVHPDLEPGIAQLLPQIKNTLEASFLPDIIDNAAVMPAKHAARIGAAIVPFYKDEAISLDPSLVRATPERLLRMAERYGLSQNVLSEHYHATAIPSRGYQVGTSDGIAMAALDLSTLQTVRDQTVHAVPRGIIVVPTFEYPMPNTVHGAVALHELLHVVDLQNEFRDEELTPDEGLARQSTLEFRGYHMTICGLGERGIIGYGREDAIRVARGVEDARRWRVETEGITPFEATPDGIRDMLAKGAVRPSEPSQ